VSGVGVGVGVVCGWKSTTCVALCRKQTSAD
jgi:hypothetical protein